MGWVIEGATAREASRSPATALRLGTMPLACGQAPRESTVDVVKMGVAFTFIFTAFQTSSSFQATVLKDLGFGESLGFTG